MRLNIKTIYFKKSNFKRSLHSSSPKNPQFNKYWLVLIENSRISKTSKKEKSETKNSKIEYNKHDLLNTKLKNLDFDLSNNFFTEKFIKTLTQILDYDKFNS
jgi:hypothetical protein